MKIAGQKVKTREAQWACGQGGRGGCEAGVWHQRSQGLGLLLRCWGQMVTLAGTLMAPVHSTPGLLHFTLKCTALAVVRMTTPKIRALSIWTLLQWPVLPKGWAHGGHQATGGLPGVQVSPVWSHESFEPLTLMIFSSTHRWLPSVPAPFLRQLLPARAAKGAVCVTSPSSLDYGLIPECLCCCVGPIVPALAQYCFNYEDFRVCFSVR